MKAQLKTFGFWFGVIAISLSLFTLYRSDFRTNLIVYTSQDIVFHVGMKKQGEQEKPAIYVGMSFANTGGKQGVIQETRLDARMLVNNNTIWSSSFEPVAEVENMLVASELMKPSVVQTIVILGRSVEYRQYAFLPLQEFLVQSIPKSFDFEFDLMIRSSNEWLMVGTYRCENVNTVWDDLQSGPPFNSEFGKLQLTD